jgi:hypothetical protein
MCCLASFKRPGLTSIDPAALPPHPRPRPQPQVITPKAGGNIGAVTITADSADAVPATIKKHNIIAGNSYINGERRIGCGRPESPAQGGRWLRTACGRVVAADRLRTGGGCGPPADCLQAGVSWAPESKPDPTRALLLNLSSPQPTPVPPTPVIDGVLIPKA